MTTDLAEGPDDAQSTLPRLRTRQHLSLSAFWFGTNMLWGALLDIIIPTQAQQISPAHKAAIVGWTEGLGAVIALIVPLIVGALSDRSASRWGRRRPYMASGTAINMLGLLVMWNAGVHLSLALYIVGYLIVNLGNNIATASYTGMIPDLVPIDQHGEASGYMAMMTQAGNIMGLLSAGILMGKGYVGASYVLIAVTLAFCLAVNVLGVRETPRQTAPEPMDWLELLKSFWIDPRQYPDFGWVWITRALMTAGQWTVQPFILYYVGDVIGVKDPQATGAFLLTVILASATVAGVLGGKISDRIGRKRVVYLASVLVAFASVLFIFGHTLVYTFVVGLIYGVGYGTYISVDWALGCDVLPNKEDAAKDMGVWHISMVLPQSLAPPVASIVLGWFGHTITHNADGEIITHYAHAGYTGIFLLSAFFYLLGAILIRNVRSVR